MARYEITSPDGQRFEIMAPDNASQDEVMAFFRKSMESQQPEQKAAPDVSVLESLGRGALQGVSLGFADEIYGGVKGAANWIGGGEFGDTYAKERDAVREANRQAQEANPTSYFAGEIGGGFAVPGGAALAGAKGARALANAGLKARSLSSAKGGMAYGAAYGLGKGEGDIESQAFSTLGGGVAGGVVGGLLPGAVQLGSAALRVPAQAVRVVSDPRRVAVEKVAEALSRDSGSEATKYLPIINKQLTNEWARSKSQAVRATNDPATTLGNTQLMLADMGGQNTRDLIRAATNMPNARAERFRQVLDRRQATQPKRLERSLSNNLSKGETYYASVDDIVAKRDAMAEPMFRAAFAVETPMTQQLARVMERPTMKELNALVARKLADEDKPIGLMTRTEMLHRMKLELDGQIGMAIKAEKMGNRPSAGWDKGTLMTLKRDMLKAIDNKPYKYALEKYSGPSALKTAANEGFEEALTAAPEQLASKISSLTKSEAEMWRMGAARAIMGRVREGNVMRDRTKSIFDTPDMRARLKAIFPDNKRRAEFLRDVSAERRMVATRQAAQGNSTTAKQLINAQEAGKGVRLASEVANAATGGVQSLVSLLERGTNFASGITPKVAAEILDLGMKGPKGIGAKNSRAIDEALRRVQARNQSQDALVRALLPAQGALSGEMALTSSRR